MNVMKPIAIEEIPKGDDWLYEVKYDGFRCVLHWERDEVKITSRNNKDLSGNFPEIINYCHKNKEKMNAFLPVKMDGELVVLNNPFQANFSWIQKRGRLKNEELIRNKSEERPATFMAFDLLQYKGKYLYNKNLLYRKQLLKDLFTAINDTLRMYKNDWIRMYKI